MKAQRPSQTSALVAFLRALAHDGLTSVPSFADPTARKLLPFPWSTLHAGIRRATRRLEPENARRRFAPLVDLLPLRTLHIDEELAEAVAQGCRQLVILGAGLDGRAHRLPGLASVSVFEVDHPATQADKRARARGLPLAAHRLTYVPVDFEHERLARRLPEAGFDPSTPTVWIWEGVTQYLTDAAIASTLADVSALSAPGSRLIVNYREPGEIPGAGPMRWFTQRVKEPQIGDRSRDTMAREVETAGLKVLRDSSGGDWAVRYGAPPPTHPHLLRTRDLVAEKP